MSEADHMAVMKVGDLLEYRCPKFGIIWQWKVVSICLGAAHQESLIEVHPVMQRPGNAMGTDMHTVFVPEPMTRMLTLVSIGRDQE